MIPRFKQNNFTKKYKLITNDKQFDLCSIDVSQNNESPHGAHPSTVYYINVVSDDLDLYEWCKKRFNNPRCDFLLHNECDDQHIMIRYCNINNSIVDEIDTISPTVVVEFSTVGMDIDNLYNLSQKYEMPKRIMRNNKINDILND